MWPKRKIGRSQTDPHLACSGRKAWNLRLMIVGTALTSILLLTAPDAYIAGHGFQGRRKRRRRKWKKRKKRK